MNLVRWGPNRALFWSPKLQKSPSYTLFEPPHVEFLGLCGEHYEVWRVFWRKKLYLIPFVILYSFYGWNGIPCRIMGLFKVVFHCFHNYFLGKIIILLKSLEPTTPPPLRKLGRLVNLHMQKSASPLFSNHILLYPNTHQIILRINRFFLGLHKFW